MRPIQTRMLIAPDNNHGVQLYSFIQRLTAEVQEKWGTKVELPRFEWLVKEERKDSYTFKLRRFVGQSETVTDDTVFGMNFAPGVEITYYGKVINREQMVDFTLEHLRKRK